MNHMDRAKANMYMTPEFAKKMMDELFGEEHNLAGFTDVDHSAAGMLKEGAKCLEDRASERDRPEGERSMAACVRAFNALFGYTLTEEQGWLFMALLKVSRSHGGKFRRDDYVDAAAYMALAGETAACDPFRS